jgi:hypothetical protein
MRWWRGRQLRISALGSELLHGSLKVDARYYHRFSFTLDPTITTTLSSFCRAMVVAIFLCFHYTPHHYARLRFAGQSQEWTFQTASF